MSIDEIQPRDAGPAPSAPSSGPLMNISHAPETIHPAEGNPLPAVGSTTADAVSPPQTLFVPRQQEPPSAQTLDDVPAFDAGPARIDLMTTSVQTSVTKEIS